MNEPQELDAANSHHPSDLSDRLDLSDRSKLPDRSKLSGRSNLSDALDPLERQLVRALRRVDPPEALTQSLLLTAEAEERRIYLSASQRASATASIRTVSDPRKPWNLPRPAAWTGGALAAMLLLGTLVGEQLHVRHQRQQAQLAQQQFETALRVTDQALDQTRQQLARAGLRFP